MMNIWDFKIVIFLIGFVMGLKYMWNILCVKMWVNIDDLVKRLNYRK